MYYDDYETIDQEAHEKWTNEQGEYEAEKKAEIKEQEGKDVFEYSVFGSPQQKIVQFAQSKLGDFNA